jgi:hypothetical protein
MSARVTNSAIPLVLLSPKQMKLGRYYDWRNGMSARSLWSCMCGDNVLAKGVMALAEEKKLSGGQWRAVEGGEVRTLWPGKDWINVTGRQPTLRISESAGASASRS